MAAFGLSVMVFALQIIGLASISTDNGRVISVPWTVGDVEGGSIIYIGAKRVVTDANGDVSGLNWSDAACVSDYCDSCNTACADAVRLAIVSFITCLPNLKTPLARMHRKNDLAFTKNMAMITGCISFFSTLSSLASFAEGCYANLPSELVGTGTVGMDITIDWSLGSAFQCLLAATVLKGIEMLLHVMLPAPRGKSFEQVNMDAAPSIGGGDKDIQGTGEGGEVVNTTMNPSLSKV